MMNNKPSNLVKSLPADMLSEILGQVASKSITDFVNTKLSCKAFLGASNYNHIFEKISLENVGFVPWFGRERVFFKRCKDARNAEALYRKGMLDFFSRRKRSSGLRYLKKAVEKGHVEARYTYGLILVSFGDEQRNQGLQVLSSLNLTSCRIRSCRLKTRKSLGSMWVYRYLTSPKIYTVINGGDLVAFNCDHDMMLRSNRFCSENHAWEEGSYPADNLPRCDSCFWDREAALFCNMVTGQGMPIP
ncbi:hypothetical protein PTKIN_Ptkin01aG0297800 [Pterospermum kingtungense]